MTYQLPRAVNGHTAFEEHGEPDTASSTASSIADTTMLDAVRRAAADLLARSPQQPSTLNVRAGGVSVEMAWHSGEAAPVAAAPVATPVTLTPVPSVPAGETVTAATVGVFYRAPSPGAPPFVSEGDEITPGQQVAIIEAMKLMLPVEADRGGRIAEVLVGDGEAVEFGQPLFRLAAADEITEQAA